MEGRLLLIGAVVAFLAVFAPLAAPPVAPLDPGTVSLPATAFDVSGAPAGVLQPAAGLGSLTADLQIANRQWAASLDASASAVGDGTPIKSCMREF